MGNEIITWESSRNLDFGIDFALFDNRLQTTFDLVLPDNFGYFVKLGSSGCIGN